VGKEEGYQYIKGERDKWKKGGREKGKMDKGGKGEG
jgi:hypothetical protein